MKRPVVGMFVAALTAALSGPSWAQDVVTLKDETQITGKITALNSREVTIIPAKADKPVPKPVEEVTGIALGDPSESMRKAGDAVSKGNWDIAIKLYDDALEEVKSGKLRSLHKEFIYYNKAQVYRKKSDKKEDKDEYLKALKRLREDCGDCYLRRQSYEEALRFTKSNKMDDAVMAILAEKSKEPQPLGGEAELEMARLKEKTDAKAAKEIYARLARNTGQTYTSDAKIGYIHCLRTLSATEEMKTACREVLDAPGGASPGLIQAASAAYGEILMKEADKDKTKRRDAELAFARAISIGPPWKDEPSDDYEIALYYAGTICLALANESSKEAAKNEYRMRAENYFRELARAYKSSNWGQLAVKQLAALGAGEKPKDKPNK